MEARMKGWISRKNRSQATNLEPLNHEEQNTTPVYVLQDVKNREKENWSLSFSVWTVVRASVKTDNFVCWYQNVNPCRFIIYIFLPEEDEQSLNISYIDRTDWSRRNSKRLVINCCLKNYVQKNAV